MSQLNRYSKGALESMYRQGIITKRELARALREQKISKQVFRDVTEIN